MSPDKLIEELLQAMPESVRNATDGELLEGFLDMDAPQEVRDTAQLVLEARKYLRDNIESNIIALHDHEALTCECGSVAWNLLRSGKIECDGCQMVGAKLSWKEARK